MSNPGESDSNADNKAENSLSIEEKDISPKTQVIQPTGISSISGINETDMEDKTANPISSLEFQIVEHALISQEGKDKKINQIEYINKDDGGLKQALEFEIAASQNVDTPENANKLSSDEKQSFHVPTVNKTMPTQEEDDLTSEEIDKIDQASVTENFESPDIKLNCETDIDSVEVLQPMKVATDDDLQEVKESTTQPMQHAESTVNENSPVLCDMTIITNGATTDECTDGEETNGSSPKFELPIHTDKEDGYVEKAIGRTEECQVQQVKLYEDNILEGSKLEPAASSEKIFKTSDHCFRQELVDAIKVVQTQPEEEENIKSHIKANNDQSEHPTSDEIQTNSTREMFPPTIQACVLTNESQRSEIATYMVQDNEPLGTEYLANHHDITAKTHNAEAAERTRRHRESEISPFLEQQMTHEKVLEQKSQLHPPDLAQPLEMMVQPLEISEIVSTEGSQHQEESTVVVNVAAGSEKETEKAPESPRDLSLSFDKEETPSLHYTNKFNLLVPITEVEASKAVSTLDTDAMADEDNSLVLEKRSNNLLGTNTAHSTVQQEEATLNVQITYIKESVVVSNVAAGSEKQTAKTPESPRDLMFSYDKEEDTSMHETTKSNLLVPITEVEVSCTVSAFNAGAITDKSSSPSIDARNDDLLKIFNNSLALVQHTEANLHEKMSSSEDPTAMNYVAAGIEKETVSETPESTKDLLPSLEKEGSSSSHESDNSNHVTPIPQVQELEAVSAFDTVAVTNEESICLSVTEMENNDLKGMTDNAPALVRQGESILNKQMSSTEDSVIVTNVVTGFDKEPARKIQEPTRYINSSFEKEEASSSYTTDGSDLTIQILEVKSSQDALAFEMGSMTKNNDPPVIESGNDDMVRMNNTGTSLSQKTDAILHAQISSGENSVAASHVAVVPVPEVKESEAVSAFNQGATTRDSYPAIDTADHDLLEIPIIVPVLSRQTEATQYGQMLCTKDSLVATHVTGIVKEAANMTTESSRDLKLSFDEEETSSSFQTDEYNITMPIPEVEASKAIAAFDTGKMTHKDSSQVIERGYNDLLGANETVSILVQPVEPTLHEKTFSIEDAVIMNHFSAGMGEATESDTSEKARNLQLSINEEEVASSHETDKSNLMVQIQDTEATEAISDLYASAMTDKNNSPVIESGNYKLQGMTDTTTVLDQQVELASVQKMSFEEEAIVVTHVSARIEKETSSDTPESTRSLQQPFEEEDASSSHETDEFELVSLPEDTTPGAVPTFDIGEGADKDSSPVMETGNNKLNVMASTVDNLVARTEAIQNEQMSSTDDSEVVTHVALGIEKETASKTLESMEDSQISFEDKETSNSYDIDASYLPVPIPQSAEFKVPAFDTGAMADERISPIIETRNDDSQKLTADLLVPINNTPCLDHQVEATLHQKMSSIEVPVDERNVSPGMEMETVSETTESTRDLQLSFNQEESLCERDRSNPDITITEVEASEATSEFDPVAMTDKTKFPVIESENNDSLGMTHTKTGLVQQDGDALLEQMSHVEDSKVVTQVSAEIANETSSETLQSTRDLQLPLEEKETSSLHGNEKSSLMVEIPRVEEEDASRSHETDKSDLTVPTLQVEEEDGSNSSETDKANLIIPIPEDISTFDRGADAHEDGSLVRETGYNKLGGDTNPVPALVPQAEATLNGQLSSTDNSVVGSQDVTGVQAETANETPESTGDLQHSFKKEEDSNTYDIDKSNLAVPILEVEATESVSALVTDAITDNENSPDKHTGNDDSLGLTDNIPVLTNIKAALVQQTGNITNEEILSIKDSVVEKNNAVRTEKETMSELTESTGDLKFKLKEEESSHEIDKSKITIPIPEVEESDAAPAFEAVPVTDKIMIPDIQSENNDFLGMTNTKTALVQQDGGSLLEQMSYVENLTVVTQVSAGIGKETSSETLESTRDLRLSAEEKEASSLRKTDKSSQLIPIPQAEELDASSSYKSDKSELMAPIPEDTSEAISTFEVGSSTDKDGSPTMEIGIDKLKRVTNTVPALVAQAEVTLNKETSATDNLIVVTQVTTGIDEGTANETHQSGGDLQLPFKEEETSNSYDIDKSNLAVPIPELEPPEVISTFNTGDMICGESSPAQETSSDDSPELTNDLLVLTNIKPELVQQTEATLDEQMSSTKVLVAETQDSAANEKETVSKIPESIEDLQPSFGENESVCEIDKSNITVPLSKVKEAVAATAFETDAVTDKITIPGIQSENNDLLKINNAETALVQQNGVTLIEKMLSVEDSKVVTRVSTGIGKETSSETLESTKELQLAAKEKENLSQIDKSNITVPFSEFEDLEADQTSEIDAVTDKFITPVFQSENNNLLPMTNTQTALVQQDGATLLQQMSCVEDSIFLPKVSAEIGKETSSDILVSTKDLQLSVDDKEASNLHDSNKSSQMFHIPDAEEEVSLSSQEIEKFELMSLIPEDTASEAVSTFDIRAEPNQEASPAMETGNNDLVEVTNTVSALVTQEEVTLNDQISATDDSIVVTQVAGGIEEENSSEKPQSMGNLQLSFEEKEASNSYDDKSNLKVSITEVEQTEAVSAFDRGAITHEESSPVIETRNDDSLVLTDNLLAQQAEPIQHEQMSTIEESMVETCEATRTKKGTVRETAKSTRDIKLSVDQEESLHEIDKSNISVPISKIEASEAAPAFERITVTDNIIIPVGESENNNLIEMGNTKTALVHQDQATISEEMSSLEESMVVTQVPARIGKETSSETFESTNDLQLSVEEKEASSFHESDKSSQTFGTSEAEEENSLSSQETEKSELLASIPEDTTSKAVSADDIGVETYQGNSPAMETGDNKLMGVINTVPVEVAQAEITLHEQTSSKDVSIIGAQATGINEETAIGSLQSMQKLELSFDEEANPKSFDINKSNLVVPITEVEETEVVSAFDMVAMTHEDSSPLIESRNDDSLRFTNDLLVPTSPEPALVRKSQPIQHEQMSSIEQLVVETHDATENNKETVSEIPESTGELKLSSEQEESLCKIGESNISAPIPKVDALEAAPAFEMTAMAEDIISPFGESENDDLLEMSNPENTLVHQDSATLLDKISCVEDKVVVTNDSAGIGKDTSSKTPDSTRDLQISFEEKEASIFCESNKSSQMVQIPEVEEEDTLNSHETDKSELVVRIPEDTTLQSVPSIDVAAEAVQDESPSMDTENNNLERVINTEPALNAQTETTTLNEQTSSIDDTVHATQVAAGIEEETVTETPQLMGNIQPLFAEKELSHSYDNKKSNAAVPILEVEAAEAVSAIEMYAMAREKSSTIEIKKDDTQELTGDVLVLTNTQPALIQQAEAAPHEQIPSIEELVVETNDATGTEKETMRETPGSARDLQPPFKQEESLCEIDKSYITVPNPEVEALEAASAFEMISGTEKNSIPVEESENNELLEMTNTKIAPVHQDKATLLDQISCAEGSMVVTSVPAGTEKDTSSEIPETTEDLQLSDEEKEASSLYESDKSSQIVQIPEVEENDTILGAVSTNNIAAETDQDDSLAIEHENNKLVGVINTVPILVAQTETAINEKTPSTDDSMVVTQVATGIEEEIVHEPLPSMENLQLSFEEGETSHSYDIGKSNLEVPTLDLEATEAVSAFDTGSITHEKGSPVIEIKNDGALELTDDLLVLTNTETGLIQQAESTPDERMPFIEESLVETHNATGTAKETVREIPGSTKDLQFSFEREESLCEIERSNTTAPPPEVDVSEAAPALEMIAVTGNITIPDGELKNNDLIKISNPETTLVHQDMATRSEQISCVQDSIVVTDISAEIGKDTSSKSTASTRDLQLSVEKKEAASSLNESDKLGQMVQIPETDKSKLIVWIPEDTTLGVMSTIDIAAGSDQNDSPVMENDKDILVGMINTVPASVTKTEATLNEKTSSIDDSVTKTRVAAEIEEETARETQSMGNVQHSVEDEKTSHSYDIGKSNLEVPIPEIEATEAVSAFDIVAMTHEECSPLIKIINDNTLELNDDLLVLTNTEQALVQHTEDTHEQMPTIEVSLVETNDATGTEKETVSETPGSTRDLQLPFKQEERLPEIDESNITVPIPEVEALEPAKTFEMISTNKTNIHVGESENNHLLGKSNPKTALLEKISCVEDSTVVTHVSAGIRKNISSETPYSTRDLDLSVEEKGISSLHESDKSSQTVHIPEDTRIEAESTFAMSSEANQNSSPDMGTENNKSVEVTKAVPALVAQADGNLNEQISSINNSIVVTRVASQIEEGTASEILQSMEDLQLLFEKKEASSSYGIDKSNLAVLIPEAVSAFDTDAKTQKERSSVKETTNNDPLELIDDYLVMTNIEPTLVQQTEATVHKQMSPIEESIFETRDAAETEKETVTVNPESTGDLELSFEQEEGICEIDKSIAVSRAETEPSETDPFEMVAVSDKINIPTIESKNNDLLETTSMKTTLAQQDGATQFKQTSCVEDLMVATYISAEIGKGSSNEIPESTRYLHFPVDEEEKSSLHESDRSSQMVPIKEVKEEDATSSSKLIVPIPEDTKLAAVSNFEIGAEADEDSSQDRDSSPAMETQNNKLVVTNTVPALVAQATLNEQTSDLDDSIVVTKVASGIEEETARETPQSMGDLHLPFEENEASNSCNTDKSNLLVLIPEAEATGVSSFDTDAKTRMESSPVIETRNDDPLELISDYLVLNKTEPALVQWAEATLREQMSYIEEPVVETHIAVATEKKSVTKNPESTGNLQPSLRQEEVRCEIDKSNSVGSIPEVAPSEATPFEMVKVTEKIIAPVIESKNNDLSEMTNTEAGLVQQDEATLSEQMSCIEDSMVVTYITAEIGKETSSEIAESTRDIQIAIKDIEAPSFHESGESSLQAQIPDVEEEDTSSSHEIDKSELMVEFQKNTSEAVSTFNIGGGADPGSSPAMETENKKSAGITSTLPALVAQAEITLNEQLSSIDDSAVVAHVATEIENEIASETPQSMGDFKLSFEEKEASTSYDIDKSDLPVSIPEVEATEAFSAFNTGATSYQKSSPVIKTRNDDPLELTGDLQVVTNTEPALAQNVEATLHEQTSSIEKPVVESHIAAATEKETVTENPVSTRDLHLSLDKEERFCEVDKSNITVPAPEFEASEAAPFEIISVTDKIIIPVIESKNNDLLDMNNTKTALVQQDGATLFEQNSCVDSMVVKYISAEIDKETSNEIPESTKDSEASSLHESGKSSLQVQIPDVEENDALSSHETDKFKSMVLIPEDVGADQNSSPAMETENNKLEGVTNTVPSLVTQAEIALNEQTSSVNESIVVAQVASAIEEETATETPQSMGDIELSFKEEEATEAVSAFNTVLMSHVKSSPVIEPRNEDSVGLPNDLLVLTNTKPALVQKAEAILHEQMLSIEDSVVDKHTTAATEKETENETPESSTEDLQLSVKDVLCEIDKSNVKVAVPEVEATEAAPEFNVLAVPEINIIPVTELENNDIPRMTNTETAPVQLDGASLLEQMSHAEDPMVVTHVSAGIWKETSIQTLESAQDLQLSFKEKEVPDLHESDRSMSSGSNSRNI